MINGFDVQKASKEGLERSFESLDAFSKGVQALAVESAEYSKRAFEESASHFERLMGSKSVETAMAAQSEYMKASYEKAIGQANRFGELYAGLVKDASKPFEAFVPTYGK